MPLEIKFTVPDTMTVGELNAKIAEITSRVDGMSRGRGEGGVTLESISMRLVPNEPDESVPQSLRFKGEPALWYSRISKGACRGSEALRAFVCDVGRAIYDADQFAKPLPEGWLFPEGITILGSDEFLVAADQVVRSPAAFLDFSVVSNIERYMLQSLAGLCLSGVGRKVLARR